MLIFVVLACFVYSKSFAQEKIYIDSNDVIIGENGIFVKIGRSVYQTKCVFSDEYGNFISSISTWKCPSCDRDYPGYEKECPIDRTGKDGKRRKEEWSQDDGDQARENEDD